MKKSSQRATQTRLDAFEQRVRNRLAKFPLRSAAETLAFEVRDRLVILSGRVRKPGLRRRAERAVRELTGVGAVVNRIQIANLS